MGEVNVLTLKEHASDLVGSESPYIGSARLPLSNQVMQSVLLAQSSHFYYQEMMQKALVLVLTQDNNGAKPAAARTQMTSNGGK